MLLGWQVLAKGHPERKGMSLAETIRSFHLDALATGAVPLNVDPDVVLTVPASPYAPR